jgi:hypothetical protein
MTRLLLCAVALLAVARVEAAVESSGCDLGWFVVDGKALLDDVAPAVAEGATVSVGRHAIESDSVHGRVVSVVGNTVAIEGICPATTATVTRKKKRTKLKATWDGCGDVAGKVQLAAAVSGDDCATMRGKVTAKSFKPKRRRFAATRTLGNPDDCGEDDTFAVIEQKIFGAKGCRVATCHGEFQAGDLDLRPGVAHLDLVEQPATTPGALGEMRVVPGDPEASFLWRKLTGALDADEGTRMPATGSGPLDALELELVRAWIAAGAPAAGRLAEAPCPPHAPFEPAQPLPPPPGGYQLVFDGPVLQPGEEMEGCLWMEVPNDVPFSVGTLEYSLNPGSHHFALWDHVRGAPPALNQFNPGDVACIRTGAPIDGITISGAPESPYFVDAFPAGVGNTIEARKLIGLNPHYFNEFDVPVQMKGWINLHPVDGPFLHEAETVFSGPASLDGKSVYNIFVEPFATGTLRLRMTNTLDRNVRIFHMSSHQHQRGTRFTAWNGGGEKIFENFDWAHPAILSFDDPYTLAPGEHIDFECEWDNGVTREVRRCGDSAMDAECTPGDPVPLRFGLTAQDEMCYLVGFYYAE